MKRKENKERVRRSLLSNFIDIEEIRIDNVVEEKTRPPSFRLATISIYHLNDNNSNIIIINLFKLHKIVYSPKGKTD